uniref:Uncharacterized protein n=1 Tax=Graphocephala atropunctata TaxID=36148 RepID=A0A1B6MJJ6_9HEMI
MKIKVPDDIFIDILSGESSSELQAKEDDTNFEEEIRNILKLSKIPSKFIVEKVEDYDINYNLQLLSNFTKLCREEILTRHVQAVETIQSKTDELQYQFFCQQKQLADHEQSTVELQENAARLIATRKLVQEKHLELSERLKETLHNLQNRCKSKTLAERKMAQDLKNYQKKTENLQVSLVETSSKMNYYTTQVKVQTGIVERKMKPLYLDKDRAVFMKANLNNMRQHIEELVHRVKNLKTQTTELSDNGTVYD